LACGVNVALKTMTCKRESEAFARKENLQLALKQE